MHALNPLVLKDHPNIVYLHTWLNQSPESVQHNSRWAALHTISKNCQYDKLANSKLANSLKTAEDCIEMYFGTPQFLSCLENRFMQSQKPKVKKKKATLVKLRTQQWWSLLLLGDCNPKSHKGALHCENFGQFLNFPLQRNTIASWWRGQ